MESPRRPRVCDASLQGRCNASYIGHNLNQSLKRGDVLEASAEILALIRYAGIDMVLGSFEWHILALPGLAVSWLV
jgi:hypothetical protein